MTLRLRAKLLHQISLTTYALREAFVTLIPYLILSSIATILLQALPLWENAPHLKTIYMGAKLMQDALPILLLVSIAFQLSKLKNVDSAGAILLSTTLLITIFPLNAGLISSGLHSSTFPIFSFLIPIVSTCIFAAFLKSKWIVYPQTTPLADSVRMIYRYTPAFILSYLSSLIIFELIHTGLNQISAINFFTFNQLANNTDWMIVFRTICTHLLTFTGVHGTNIFDLIVGNSQLGNLIAPNLTSKNLIDTFVVFGGIGASLSLAIAILIVAKDGHAIRVSKIALPFLVFNVTEILLYGLPIVLNRKLFIPFVFVPLLNLTIALMVVHTGLFTFTATQLPWTTPIFISGYLATNGDWMAVLFQALLLTIDVGIYMLFARTYVNTQSTTEHLNLLKEKLDISESIQTKQGLKFQEAQAFLVNAHLDIHRIIELIVNNDLIMFYQPIIDIKNQQCSSFEALLRLKMHDGKIVGPYFIPILERAGLSTVIDIWVCKQVRLNLEAWHMEEYYPTININLHPDTLVDEEAVKKIAQLLSGFDVQFEVIERAFLLPEKAAANIQLLKEMQFKLVIDDFGTGYSSLEHLHHTSAETIKFDKQLIDIAESENGYKIYMHSSRMCVDLGFRLVSEGIETESQLKIVKEAGIQFVQGWYFSKALPTEEAKQFALTFNQSHSLAA